MSFFRTATKGAVSNIQQVANFASKGPAQAAIVGEGLIRAGAPSDEIAAIFEGHPAHAEVVASLRALGRTLLETQDTSRTGLSASPNDTANDLMRVELVGSVVRQFGSVQNARKIQTALSTLKAADFEWYEAMHSRLG